MTAWFSTIFEEPQRVYVWGFHPCQLFLDPQWYYRPDIGTNIGPREFGGDFDGCWVLTFSKADEAERGFWAQHGPNQEARRFFEHQNRLDLPRRLLPMDENQLSQWLTEVHAHLAMEAAV